MLGWLGCVGRDHRSVPWCSTCLDNGVGFSDERSSGKSQKECVQYVQLCKKQ